MSIRQFHDLTPHWNYEKVNQIIGCIRRVGSHDALSENEQKVDMYLYMEYNPKVKCTNEIKYGIDYLKYIVCERKYNDALKYIRAL